MCKNFFGQIITVLLIVALLTTSVPVMVDAAEEGSPQYLYAVGYLDADQFISRYGMKGSVVSQSGSFMGSGSVFNRENKDYTVIVRGDISGDGKITSADYLGLKRSFSGSKLSDIAALAGDINGDDRLTSTDYLSIKKYFNGAKELWDADSYVGERYMSYRIWNFSISSMSNVKSIVDAAKNVGFNAINLHIPWYHVEKEDGVYDYSAFDPMVDYIVNEKGMSCAIILYMGRIPSEDTVLSDEDYDRDPNGNLSYGTGTDRTGISFSSEKAVSKCVDFYEDAVKHYDSLYGRNIMLYLPCFSTYNETEYSVNGDFDYAPCAIEGFRAFLSEKYGSIDNFNQKLGMNYDSFDSVNPPLYTAMDNMGVLWYQYRHGKLKNIIDKLAAAQHTACPDTKFCVQFGSVHDSTSIRRGTYDFTDLCENADVIWVDDGPASKWDWSMDYLWANLPRTVEIGNEIDGPSQIGATMERYLNQGLVSYQHGAKYVVCANWGFDTNFSGWSDIWREISGTWLTDDRPELITPAKGGPTFEVSAYGLFRSGNGLYEGYYSSPANALAVNDLTNIMPQNRNMYRFAIDFSNGQGWSYGGWRNNGTGKKVPASFNSGRWFASDCWIGPGAISPGTYIDADVIFTAPSDGTATLVYSYGLGNKAAIGSGVRILLNGEQIYPTEGEFAWIPSDAPLKDRLPVTLKKGDELTFRLTRGNGDNGALVFASVNVEMN